MDIILLWTIWATAFTTPPELDVLEQLCRRTHPAGRITISRELLSWNERHYPAAMIICARLEEEAAPAEPGAVFPRKPAPLESAPLESAPLESAPLESAPLESAPLESAPRGPQTRHRGARQSI